MTEVRKLRTKPRRVEALQIRLGETTRNEILEFCPRANVGVGSRHTSQGPVRDEADLRWIQVATGPWGRFEDVADGEWIIWDGEYHYVHDDAEIARLFEPDDAS
jgi:hypothetical protein